VSASSFDKGDHFDISGPELPKTEKRSGAPVRDDGALATGKDRCKEAAAAIRPRMTDRKGRSEQGIEPSRSYIPA
jgi:hypothetical protein